MTMLLSPTKDNEIYNFACNLEIDLKDKGKTHFPNCIKNDLTSQCPS